MDLKISTLLPLLEISMPDKISTSYEISCKFYKKILIKCTIPAGSRTYSPHRAPPDPQLRLAYQQELWKEPNKRIADIQEERKTRIKQVCRSGSLPHDGGKPYSIFLDRKRSLLYCLPPKVWARLH